MKTLKYSLKLSLCVCACINPDFLPVFLFPPAAQRKAADPEPSTPSPSPPPPPRIEGKLRGRGRRCDVEVSKRCDHQIVKLLKLYFHPIYLYIYTNSSTHIINSNSILWLHDKNLLRKSISCDWTLRNSKENLGFQRSSFCNNPDILLLKLKHWMNEWMSGVVKYLVPAAVHDGVQWLWGSVRSVQPDPSGDVIDHFQVGAVFKWSPTLGVDLPHHHTCTQTH